MKNNGTKRFVSVALSVALLVGSISLSPVRSAAAADPLSTTANYNQFQVKLTADPATDTPPNSFGTADSAGRIWTDKSVTAESDGSFGVKLSALAQEYMTEISENPGVGGGGNSDTPAADVTFILDMSLSMGSTGRDVANGSGGNYYRVEAMAMAANTAIRTVMNANPKNRVAVYWFGGAANTTHVGTMLGLGHYAFTSGHESEDYLKYASYTITPNSNLRKDGGSSPIPAASVSLGTGTPTQDGIMYGVSSTLNQLGSRNAEPKRQPYVFILSDGAATIGKTTWSTLPSNPSTPSSYTNQSNLLSAGDTNKGSADHAAVTILTGMYMKNLMETAYSGYNGSPVESRFYTVGLGSSTAINGPYTDNRSVYAWAGLDPKRVDENKSNNSFNKGSADAKGPAVATYEKITQTYATSGNSSYANAFIYSDFYTFASTYSALSGAFNELANDVEASTTILPLLEIPEGGGLGGSEETADMASAIVFVDEIGADFAVDTTTLKIGSAVATVDASMNIADGTAYKFAGYGSKAVIRTVDDVTSLTWYIDADDMQAHIYRFANRTSPVEGQYTVPASGAFTLGYKVKPAFVISPSSVVNADYYLNSGNSIGGAKTAAYFAPPADSPYYADLTSTRTIAKTNGIGATYVTEESLSGGKVTMKLGNNGRLDLQLGIIKTGPATVMKNGTINYTVTIYNYTGTNITGLSVTSEGQVQSNVTVPANSSKELTFSTTAPGTAQTITSSTAVVSGVSSNTVATVVTDTNAPVAVDGSLSATEDGGAVNDTLVATDTDGDPLVYSIVGQPSQGTVTITNASTGAYTYTPNANANGADSFTFKANDGTVDSNTATITITIAAVNDAPVAEAGSLSATEDGGAVSDTLVATDIDGNPLTYSIVGQPGKGTVVITNPSTGAYTYTPTANANGGDSFTFKANDGTADSNTATITITISAVNDAPVAVDGSLSATEDGGAVSGTLVATDIDGDALTYSIVGLPSQGTVTITNASTGAYTYTPNADWNGADSFTFKANDGTVDSNTATITITISAVNDAPVALDGSLSATEDGGAVSGTLVATDIDVDPLTYSIVGQPSKGTVVITNASTGAYTYTPTANANGGDSFTFKANDGTVDSNTATITITIAAVNDAPVAEDGSLSATEDGGAVSGTLVATDIDGNPLTYSIVGLPSQGTVTITNASTGAYTYTPTANANGADSFTFKANDGTVDSNTATITITIAAVNDAPVAVDGSLSATEDGGAVSGTLVATDIDVDPLTYSIVGLPSQGTVTITNATTGAYTYTPNANANGADSFTFKVSDGTADSNTATITITISAVNDAPVAVDGSLSATEDGGAVSGTLVATDIDGNPLTYSIVGQPSQGTVTITNATTGAYTYTPSANANGADSFTFKANDGTLDSNTATITITISAVNDAPVASDGSLSATEDGGAVSGTLIATDIDGNPLTYGIVDLPSQGTVTITNATTGAYTYTPTADWNGADSFTFKANDGTLDSNTATITITIAAVNDAPVAEAGSLSATEDGGAVGGTLVATDIDGDALTYSIVGQPSKGTVVITNATTGAYTYTPNADWNGADSFTFKASDGTADSNTATITITIAAVNDAPVASDGSLNATEDGGAVSDTLVATDIDGDSLTYSIVGQPSKGTVVITNTLTGAYTYTPTANANGADSFTFKANDGAADSNTATITITIAAVNDAPVAVDGSLSATEDGGAVSGTLVATDIDGDALTYSIVGQPSKGTVVITNTSTGAYTYTPTANANGADSFTFKASDGTADSNTATITITIAAVNDAPVASDGSLDATEDGGAVSGTLVATDIDGDALTYSIVSQPSKGTVVITNTATGAYTYTPTANANGADSFTFKASDGTVDSNTATITITIAAVNDPPTVANFTKNGTEDMEVSFAAADFSGKFTDIDLDALNKVRITSLPANGTLKLGGTAVIQGQEIPVASLGTLKFTPNANWHGTTTFGWNGSDGTSYAMDNATVTIVIASVNDAPVAVNDSFNTQGADTVSLHVLNNDTDVDGDALTPTIVSNPTHGTVSINPDKTIEYKPALGYKGSDSFTYKVSDGTAESNTVTVNLTVTIKEGWVGDRAITATSPEWIVSPGKPLKLTMITTTDAAEASVTFDFDGDDAGSGNDSVNLILANGDTYATDGYKLWHNVTYRLPDNISAGLHQVVFNAKDEANNNLPGTDRLANNKFKVIAKVALQGTILDKSDNSPVSGATVSLYDATGKVRIVPPVTSGSDGKYNFAQVPTGTFLIVVEKQGYGGRKLVADLLPIDSELTTVTVDFQLVGYILDLTANPSSIVGDGNTTSQLTAVLKDRDGTPVSGVQVIFSASVGTFVGSPTVTTDSQGKATITYRSIRIEGILSQAIPVSATADDPERAIYAEEQIIVTFEPASVSGTVTTTHNGTTTVVRNSRVTITADFDEDGTIDFSAEAFTDENGRYKIAVPRGDKKYNIDIVKPVQVGNGAEEKNLTFHQTVDVGTVTGAGNEVFESTRTASGVLRLQQPDGAIRLLDESDTNDNAFANQVRIKLRDPVTGSYVTLGGEDTFELTAQGVFNVPGLTAGSEYEVALVYVMPDNSEIIINSLDNDGTLPRVTITETGEMNIVDELIDPYGDITNINTAAPIAGARVELYFADTPRNVLKGNTPDTMVVLPGIPGFAPNDNANSQDSDALGKYAYMVFSESDYYLRVTKPGYYAYLSPVISVEFAIVRHDIQMTPIAVPGPGPGPGPAPVPDPAPVEEGQPHLTVNVTIESSVVPEDTTGRIIVDYINDGTALLKTGEVSLTIPDGAVVTDADGGTIVGNKIVWTIQDLEQGKKGQFQVEIRYPRITESERLVTIVAEGTVQEPEASDKPSVRSSVTQMIVSNRFGEVEHLRYILGYPDGTFGPNKQLMRAELAAIIARLINGGATTLRAGYNDVPQNHWASGYIRIVSDYGVFTGYNDGTFRPNQPVTREELAVVMARYLKLDVTAPINPHFADAQGRWSTNSVEALFRNALITGYPDGTFKPANQITRQEAVTLINRLLFRGPLHGVKQSWPDVHPSDWSFGHVEEASHSHRAIRNEDGSEQYLESIEDEVE